MFDRHEFWRDPGASEFTQLAPTCAPEFYLDLDNITKLILSGIQKYCLPEMSILEIGCGTGRNLVGLVKAGYTNVSGVEIAENSVAVGREQFPEYRDIDVKVAPIEEIIKSLPEYDVIYTQGCLMHLPYELDWVIDEIKKKAKYMIMTNEGEQGVAVHVWKRNYEEYIIRGEWWLQVEMMNGVLCPPLPSSTIKRIFLRTKSIRRE